MIRGAFVYKSSRQSDGKTAQGHTEISLDGASLAHMVGEIRTTHRPCHLPRVFIEVFIADDRDIELDAEIECEVLRLSNGKRYRLVEITDGN